MGIIDQPVHRQWLTTHLLHLLDFGRGCPAPGGGSGWLDEHGVLDPREGVHTWITARMVHVHGLGALLGVPGSRGVAERAWAGLTGPLRDREHGGWLPRVGGETPETDKAAYAHAFVVLAASTATVAGLPDARGVLDEALAVMESRFWDEAAGMVVDTWDRTFTRLDPYRGINANMHTVEAFLAAADVTGDAVWRERAARIAAFAREAARANRWRLPEHYDESWNPMLELNVDRPADPFKPYGATVGHGMEWARLFLHLEASGASGADWAGAAVELFDRAVADGWDAVRGGFAYTTDWEGVPVVTDRMHWVVAEGIGAAAALARRTGQPRYEDAYAQFWDHVAEAVLDRESGSWRHQLDADNQPAASVWHGKPDLYHAVQATLIPRLPLAPTLATAIAAGLTR